MSTAGLGIALGLAGSIAINTGNNLQSLGMHKAEVTAQKITEKTLFELKAVKHVNLWSSKTWVLGTIIFVAGAFLNFASYGFAPQSTLASLESIQFVSNLFFGKLLLKKEITKKMYLGTFLTVAGTVFSVSFSSKKSEPVEVMDDLVELWKNPMWIGYIIFIFVFALYLHILSIIWKYQRDKENERAIIYAMFSAIWGTLSVVFAKLLAQLVEFLADDVDIFSHWFTYVTVVSWILLMLFWLWRLNSALRLFDPLFVIPLLQANFIYFAIVSGGIYFKEFNRMKTGQWFGFVSGNICMFLGIALLVPPKNMKLRVETDEVVLQTSQSVFTTIITGPGRMSQLDYEIKTREKIEELWQLNEIDTLSEIELNPKDTMKLYKGDKDRTKFLKKQVANYMNMFSTCCADRSRQNLAPENESVSRDESDDSSIKKISSRPSQRVHFTHPSQIISESKHGRSGVSKISAGQWCEF